MLPNRAITVCPFCRGDLATNVHPLEKRLQLLVFTPCAIGLFVVLNVPARPMFWVVAIGGVLLLTITACAYLQLKTRSWQRFRNYERKDNERP